MAQTVVVNPASIALIHEELASTIHNVATTFESNLEQSTQSTQTLSGLRQIRGVFRLLQLHDAAKLADELLYTVYHFRDTVPGKDKLGTDWFTFVSEGFYVLSRYLDYVAQNKRALSGLLLPAINNLRTNNGKALLPESCFSEQSFDLELQCPTVRNAAAQPGGDIDLNNIKRLRHMYQLGLLGVIRDQQISNKLEMMHRAVGRMYLVCHGYPIAEFWWLIEGLLEGFKQHGQVLTPHRKRLLTIVDSQFKLLLKHGAKAYQAKVPPAVKKELLFLISVNDSQGLRSREIRGTFNLSSPAYTDSELVKESRKFVGPQNDTFACIAQNLVEELKQAKLWLEDLSREGHHRLYCQDLVESLTRVAAILEFVELSHLGQILRKQLPYLQAWMPDDQADEEKLIAIANTILCIEGVITRMAENALWRSGHCDNDAQIRELIADCHFVKAQKIVLEVLLSCVVGGKQAMVALEESSANSRAVEEIMASLTDAKGTLTALDCQRAAEIIERTLRLLEDYSKGQYRNIERKLISMLADVFVSLEFYLAELAGENDLPETLNLADESLKSVESSTTSPLVNLPIIPESSPLPVAYTG